MGCCSSSPAPLIEEEDVVVGVPDSCMTIDPAIEHEFVEFSIPFKVEKSYGCFDPKETIDSELYHYKVLQHYVSGHRLLAFIRMPPLPMQAAKYYQLKAVLCNDEHCEDYNFKSVRATISTANRRSEAANSITSSADASEMTRIISEETANGLRYVGLAPAGITLKSKCMSSVFQSDFLVDILFEVPRQYGEPYVYTIIKQPLQTGGDVKSTKPDIMGIVDANLNEGWRLVNVFLIDPTSADALRRSRNLKHKLDCLWVFEKPLSKMASTQPVYRYKVIEFDYKAQFSDNGSRGITSWNATVTEMGKRGWHLASIVPTHRKWSSAATVVYTMKVLLIFQRKLAVEEHLIPSGLHSQLYEPYEGGTLKKKKRPPNPFYPEKEDDLEEIASKLYSTLPRRDRDRLPSLPDSEEGVYDTVGEPQGADLKPDMSATIEQSENMESSAQDADPHDVPVESIAESVPAAVVDEETPDPEQMDDPPNPESADNQAETTEEIEEACENQSNTPPDQPADVPAVADVHSDDEQCESQYAASDEHKSELSCDDSSTAPQTAEPTESNSIQDESEDSKGDNETQSEMAEGKSGNTVTEGDQGQRCASEQHSADKKTSSEPSEPSW